MGYRFYHEYGEYEGDEFGKESGYNYAPEPAGVYRFKSVDRHFFSSG